MGSDAVEEVNISTINQDEETVHRDKVHISSKTSLPHILTLAYLRLSFEKETKFPHIRINV